MKPAPALLCLLALAASAAPLREHWAIQSSAAVREGGEALSTPGYSTRDWYPATLPSTVVNALVRERVYPDPYTGMNLRSIAGATYPISHNFSNIPMPPESPFRVPWWYRTEFTIPDADRGKTLWLHFDGINFRANVWLNGKRLASSGQMAGAWRLFDLDITAAARPGASNALAIEIFPPTPGDLAITFVDWNPMPPDKCMGIWRDVSLVATGPVALRFPDVATKLKLPAAELTVTAELVNATAQPVEGVLRARVEGLQFSTPVRLAARETRLVALPVQTIEAPRLWWPLHAGPQNLYNLDLSFETAGAVSDRAALRFGIREIASVLDAQGRRLFRVNGKNVLIRGAGYTFDMLLRSTPERQEAELKYVRDMNLNAVRLEGKLEDEHFLNLCDEYGILVLAGWCCCDHWERWQAWDAEDRPIAAASLRDQARRLRPHPSVAVWMNGSDNPPPGDVERIYLDVLKEIAWPNPVISNATAKPGKLSEPTGVKMNGPYDYIAPSYWLLDKKLGGAWGFATEVGPGPSPPPVESLRRMLPEDHLWPIDSFWNYHTGGGPFSTIKVFTEALNARYGAAKDLEDFARKAQVMAYEGHRAMFEAFGRNKYGSTGVIQWMQNNAWPSLIWHLYDYYLRPGGSYFGAKKACEPLHVMYAYDDHSVWVVNSYNERHPKLKVSARVYNLDLAERFSRETDLDAASDSSTRAFTLPEVDKTSPVWFVCLALHDAAGKPLSSNFYWLSSAPETLDWDKSTWYHTPTRTYADYTALAGLPPVELKTASVSRPGETRVTVENPTGRLVFYVRLKLNKGAGGEEVLPVLWQDNYFPLFPGEKREITATYNPADLGKADPVIEVDGWNVK